MPEVRHAVLGAGGVGGLIAAARAEDGQDVILVLRAETLEVSPGGIHLESEGVGDIDVDVPAVGRLDREVEVLWVAVKATQLEDALRAASPAVAGNALVIPLLDGVDHVSRLLEGLGVVGGAVVIR